MRGRKPSWIDCWVSENTPEMIACEAITVATRRERDQRIMQPVRRQLIERIVDRGGVGDQQRGLAEIIEDQGGQRHREPGEPDRHPAEMAHVGIHRLAAGHRQKGGAEDGEADVEILVDQEIEGIKRT